MKQSVLILGHALKASPWQFDSDKLQLNISIPQIYMDAMAYDYISPSRWDEGINALTINYDFSGSHTLRSDYGSQETDTSYLNWQWTEYWAVAITQLQHLKYDRWQCRIQLYKHLDTT